jgi:hypothetical protein
LEFEKNKFSFEGRNVLCFSKKIPSKRVSDKKKKTKKKKNKNTKKKIKKSFFKKKQVLKGGGSFLLQKQNSFLKKKASTLSVLKHGCFQFCQQISTPPPTVPWKEGGVGKCFSIGGIL